MDQKTYVAGYHDNEQVAKMRYNRLGNTDMTVSEMTLGSSAFGSVFRETIETESLQVLDIALRAGINMIDSAPWYGHGKAENVLGKALSNIPRSAYYLNTKVGRYMPEWDKMFDFRAERVIRSVDESLVRMGVDYIDIIQVHDMEFAPSLDVIIDETLPALQKVVDSGKARYIGITGYPLENFRTILTRSKVKIDTVLTYCRGSMNDNALQQFVPFFKEKGIGVINASALSMGLLSNRDPPAWHPATADVKEVCKQAANYCQSEGVDISRLALKFSMEQPGIATTLISTANPENMRKNLDSFTTQLSDKERATMKAVYEKYMKPLNNKHWEGIEVAHYSDKLKTTTAKLV